MEPLDGFVEGARTEPDVPLGPLLDVLLDGVAVPRPLSEGEQDMDDR